MVMLENVLSPCYPIVRLNDLIIVKLCDYCLVKHNFQLFEKGGDVFVHYILISNRNGGHLRSLKAICEYA